MKNAGPLSIPPGMVAKPVPESSADGPAGPILSQPRLPHTGATGTRQHPRAQPHGATVPLHDLRSHFRRDPRSPLYRLEKPTGLVTVPPGVGSIIMDMAACRSIRSFDRDRARYRVVATLPFAGFADKLDPDRPPTRAERRWTPRSEGIGYYQGRERIEPGASSTMNDVTRILSAIEQGDPGAADRLLPLVYGELRSLAARRLAREAPGQTLQPTALVHEAYLRLVGPEATHDWDGRGHFFAAAAEAMRRILLDRARDKKRLRRGGSRKRQELDLDALRGTDAPADDLIDLDEAITRLAAVDARAAELVKLRLFAGLTLDQAARALGIARRTAERDWAFARAWLFGRLSRRDDQA